MQCAFRIFLTHRVTHQITHRFVFSATHPDHPRRVQHAKNHLEDIILQHELNSVRTLKYIQTDRSQSIVKLTRELI
ncbi:hypothetical protein PUN28_003665 [Cardiocondyla obscurior]|uniref:Uncharacterized protein n=1 Tax=Cardiocondyla obscurior TaxID=286306 RepID=A0AAW2GJV0_9HYME